MVVGAAAGSQSGQQQEVGGRAGHGAMGGSGERGGGIAAYENGVAGLLGSGAALDGDGLGLGTGHVLFHVRTSLTKI